MNISDRNSSGEEKEVGHEMYDLIVRLYPICRSITGEGYRQTMKILKEYIPLEAHEVPSGTKVFDWTIPKEWNIKDAYVKNSNGERIIDFKKSNLHVLNYSIPIKKKLTLGELKEHLFSLPEHPDWIPYKTSYYKEDWGFCLSHDQFLQLKDEEYEVFIDSTLENGFLTYGEYFYKGRQEDEILISCHGCHPSLCNDNLSGVSLATFLAKYVQTIQPRYSYRIIFVPGTIGSITWLSLNKNIVSRIKHGLVLTGVGDSGKVTYKRSRRGDTELDRAAIHVLRHSGQDYEIMDFSPYGYDERQYCSPGFNLPVGRLSRTPYGNYPEYHTSADNLDFVKPQFLTNSFSIARSIIDLLENNRVYLNQNPYCEPQLGKRGLYNSIGTSKFAILWVLNMSDGNHSLLDIADRAGLDFESIKEAAITLQEKGLLTEL